MANIIANERAYITLALLFQSESNAYSLFTANIIVFCVTIIYYGIKNR